MTVFVRWGCMRWWIFPIYYQYVHPIYPVYALLFEQYVCFDPHSYCAKQANHKPSLTTAIRLVYL